MAKPMFTPEQEQDIHDAHVIEGLSQSAVAARFNIAQPTVCQIIARVKRRITPEDAAPAATIGAVTLPHHDIVPSPINPRKRFRQDAIVELWDSIKTDGLLLPILVRPSPVDEGKFEIIAGERRWRAIGHGVLINDAPSDYAVPVIIRPCTDRDLLKIALTENIARSDMTPLEEAEGFAALLREGVAVAEIAETVGMNKRTVQKRLKLLEGLTDESREALANGEITTEQANILASFCHPSDQATMIIQIGNGNFGTTDELRNRLLSARFPEKKALFPLAEYTGGWVEDDATGDRFFADTEQFHRLQDAAIDRLETTLKNRWDWVKICPASEHFAQWEYRRTGLDEPSPNFPAQGAVIDVKRDGTVSVTHGWYTEAVATTPKDTAPPEPMTKGHYVLAKRQKTLALQQAAFDADDNGIMATRLTVMALLCSGNGTVKIDSGSVGPENFVVAIGPGEVLERHLAALTPMFADCKGVDITHDGISRGAAPWVAPNTVAIWSYVHDLDGFALMELFTALVAIRVGTFSTFDAKPGDDPLTLAIAETLGLPGQEHDHPPLELSREALEGLRKDTLLTVARQAEIDGHYDTLKTAALKDHIAASAPSTFVLPTFRFADETTIRAMIAGPVPVPKQAEPHHAAQSVQATCDWDPDQKLTEVIASFRGTPPTPATIRDALQQCANAVRRKPLDTAIADESLWVQDLGVNPTALTIPLVSAEFPVDQYPTFGSVAAEIGSAFQEAAA